MKVTSFEADVYSALNLSAEEATQFGTLFSSALYGIAVGDACQQISEGKIADGLESLAWASAEYGIGFTPVGWAYAALKLVTAAPPAIVRGLTKFNVAIGFNEYKKLRTKSGGQYGLPETPIDFTSARYRTWRSAARDAFNIVWDSAQFSAGYGAFRQQAIEAIKAKRMSKLGYWDKYSSPLDYLKSVTSVVTDDAVREWTFANWESSVVVDILTNYVPKRIEAAQAQLRITEVEIAFTLADSGGAVLDVEEFFIPAGGGMTVDVREGTVVIETTMGTLPDIVEGRSLKFSAKLKGKEEKVTGSIDVEDLMAPERWQPATKVLNTVTRPVTIDLGQIIVSTEKRRVEVEVTVEGVESAEFRLGGLRKTLGADRGGFTLDLPPGSHIATFTGRGQEGRPVIRNVVIDVPLSWKGEPAPVKVTLDNASYIASSGALGVIKAAIDANGAKLRWNAISPQEYSHAVSASVQKAEGTVKQSDGTEKPTAQLAGEEARKQAEKLKREGESDLEERCRAVHEKVRQILDDVPPEYRGAFFSPQGMQISVGRIRGEARLIGTKFPHGPTRDIELTIEHFQRQQDKLEELLGPMLDGVASEIEAARAEVDGILEDYEKRWALLTFASFRLQGVVEGLGTIDLAQYEEALAMGETLKQTGVIESLTPVIELLEEALSERRDRVAKAEATHASIISRIESYRTVTLMDAAKVSSALNSCPREELRSLNHHLMAMGAYMNAIEAAKETEASVRRRAAEDFSGSMGAARQAMAAEPFVTILADLGVSLPPEDPSEPRPARAADLAYGLSCLQRRINKALVYGKALQREYKAFYSANRSLLEDRNVDDQAAYNFAAIDTIKGSIRDPFSGTNLTQVSVELREATEKDKLAYAALHKEFRDGLAPYIALTKANGGNSKELVAALKKGPELRKQGFLVIGQGLIDGRAPYHYSKLEEFVREGWLEAKRHTEREAGRDMSKLVRPHLDEVADASLKVLALGDAGYVGLATLYCNRQAAAIEDVVKRVRAFKKRIEAAPANPLEAERFQKAENFRADLDAAGDLGPSGIGDPNLTWQWEARWSVWVVPAVLEAKVAGDEVVGQAYTKLADAQKEAEAAYARLFGKATR